jgi:predicted enzyme related to lactoylglutathione lyase
MSTPIAHFAINADDVDRARGFYAAVFGWQFTAWGSPGFYQISTGGDGVRGALQRRRELIEGKPTIGFECTVAVDDVDAVTKTAVANGGRVLMERTTIVGVGHLVFLADPEGNIVGAMQYDENAD